MGETPRTQYARNGDVHLAYQVVGEGNLDLLLVDTWVHHVEAVGDFPEFARFLRRLSAFGRLIHFDRRGTGLSDPVPLDQLPDLETQVGDAVAVLKAAGSQGAAVIGLNDGTIVAVLLATAHPELCRSLVLFTLTQAHTLAAGMPLESIDEVIELIEANAVTDDSGIELLAPSREVDERFDRQLSRLQRYSVRPGAFGHYYRQTMEADVSAVLPRSGHQRSSSIGPATGSSPWRGPASPPPRSREPGSSRCRAPIISPSRRASTASSTKSRSS